MSTEKTELEVITLERTSLPPIRFTGTKIGSGSTRAVSGEGQNRWTTVELYRSKGGKWLASVAHMTCWQGEHDSYSATSTDTPAELIAWLTNDNDGHLGRASQEACAEAAKNDEAFGKAFVEEVE